MQIDNRGQRSRRATAKLCGLVEHLLENLVDEVWEEAEDAPVAFLCHSPDCDHTVQDVLGSHVQDLRRPAIRFVCDRFEGRQAVVERDFVAVIRRWLVFNACMPVCFKMSFTSVEAVATTTFAALNSECAPSLCGRFNSDMTDIVTW